MDIESLQRAVTFNPPVDFQVSGESECLVVPVTLLEGGTSYTFRLESGGAADLQGRPYMQGLELTFSTRDDVMVMLVPALSFHDEVVEGSTPQGVATLTGFGVGHYPGAGRPGSGNFVLMAHSSGQVDFPFNAMNHMQEGDLFIVEYGGRSYRYALQEGLVIKDTELWILDPTPSPILTIFICCAEDGNPSPTFHPPYRYVVRAALSR
jgi:LPXTG-site transpeptidase (sortase) family protein